MEDLRSKVEITRYDQWLPELDRARCKVAVDAGANTGGYSKLMADHGFFVYAFEPVPDVFEKLKQNHGTHEQILIIQFALADETFSDHEVNVLSCWTLAPAGTGCLEPALEYASKPPFKISAMRLDYYLDRDEIGFLKLDVDGWEPRVLRGARETLRRCRPTILCELSNYPAKLGTPIECFVNQIFDLGYVISSPDRKTVLRRWKDVHPIYPYHTSYDVLLLPVEALL